MPETISDWAILGAVLAWDGLIAWYIRRLMLPAWRVAPRVPKPLPLPPTLERDIWGQPIERPHRGRIKEWLHQKTS